VSRAIDKDGGWKQPGFPTLSVLSSSMFHNDIIGIQLCFSIQRVKPS
jgi:hypothetical protein